MDEIYLTKLGYGDFDDGLNQAILELDKAGYKFLPGGEGYIRPDGTPVKTFSQLPFWMQVAKAHKVYEGQRNVR